MSSKNLINRFTRHFRPAIPRALEKRDIRFAVDGENWVHAIVLRVFTYPTRSNSRLVQNIISLGRFRMPDNATTPEVGIRIMT